MKFAAVIAAMALLMPAQAGEQSHSIQFAQETTQSCAQVIGEKEAQQLVDECTQVSPATHPPCNAENACDLMTDEIKRGCAMLSGNERPGFCDDYTGD